MNTLTCSALGSKYFKFREEDGSYTEIIAENYTQVMKGILMGERITHPINMIKIMGN